MEDKHARNFTMLYLKPLLEKGLLQMTIPEKPNHKNQKYIIKNQIRNRFINIGKHSLMLKNG